MRAEAEVADAGLSCGHIDVVCCAVGIAQVPRLSRAVEPRFGPGKEWQLRSFRSVVQRLAERARGIASATLIQPAVPHT